MRKITVVTGNDDKYNEIKKILMKYGIDSEHVKLSFPETKDSVEEIAVEKAKNAFSAVGRPLIVDDTGVYFDAYNDFPGHLAKRMFNALGFRGLLRLLDNNRGASFKTVVCYTDGRTIKTFVGELRGTITKEVHPTSRPDLPYEQIFIPDGFDVPMCTLSVDEKNEISHRAKAVEKFAKWFKARELS